MSDAQSDRVRAKHDIEKFLEEHGWTKKSLVPTKLVFWVDPLNPNREALWRYDAADTQVRRNEFVKKVMES